MECPPLVLAGAPSLPSAARRCRTGVVLGQPCTINSDPRQPAGKPALNLGPQVIHEAGPLGGLGRWGGQGQEDGEEQRADGWTVHWTVGRT